MNSREEPGVNIPEFIPDSDIDVDDVGETQESLRRASEAQRGHASKVASSVDTHDVDTGVQGIHEGIDHVETDQDLVEWRDPGNLEMPPARPGFVQRLVRASWRSGVDPGNWTRALREGWRPRSLDTVDKEYAPPTVSHQSLGNVIGVEGLILCEMPVRIARQRAKFYRQQTMNQTEAIEKDVHREERSGMPIIAERTRRVTTGRYRGAQQE